MNPRARALQLLRRIEKEKLYASLVLIGESGLIRTLVLGVLRWRSRLDFMIEEAASRKLKKIDAQVVDVLRLGIVQLRFMETPAHAAVSETVDLAPPRARGFVNAVLRRVASGAVTQPHDLATLTAHPPWLIDRWSRNYGEERAMRIANANQELSAPDVLSLSGSAPPDAEPSALVPRMWKMRGSTAELDRSEFHPMDEGSAVIAAITRACGDDVLDLAAAPGGKSLYLSMTGARVIANDLSIQRLASLASSRIPRVVADARTPPFRKRFGVVLLDAPCSATGTIRKNPELKWRLEEQDLQRFAALQREMLAAAMTLASQFVVYSTCSLEPEENDEVVNGYERADITPFVPAGARSWVENGVLRLTPESGADGFTAFVLHPSKSAR